MPCELKDGSRNRIANIILRYSGSPVKTEALEDNTLNSEKFGYGPGTSHAGYPSSLDFGV